MNRQACEPDAPRASDMRREGDVRGTHLCSAHSCSSRAVAWDHILATGTGKCSLRPHSALSADAYTHPPSSALCGRGRNREETAHEVEYTQSPFEALLATRNLEMAVVGASEVAAYLLLCGSPLSLAIASLTTAREVSMLEASAP